MTDYFTGKYPITKTWAQHIASPGLGGVDYGMGVGTSLRAASGGTFEWVTPSTSPRPAWYNTGLGWVASVRRPDGTRTVYAHCSGAAVSNGSQVSDGQIIAYSGGAKGSPGAGTSTGPHVHIHDVVDGKLRARPFSTITSANSGGGGVINARKKSMTTLYWDGQNPSGGAAQWALGGDSPGTTANWITTRSRDLADKWAAVHGPAVDCGSAANFAEFGKWYMQPLKTIGGNESGGNTTIDVKAIVDAINALPAEIDRYNDGKKQAE